MLLPASEVTANAHKLIATLQAGFAKSPYFAYVLSCFQPQLQEDVYQASIADLVSNPSGPTYYFTTPTFSTVAVLKYGDLKPERVNPAFQQALLNPDRLRNLKETVAKLIPPSSTHFFLSFLTVHPDFQGKGLGSQMLSEMWEWVKANHPNRGISLHTTSEINVKFYKKNHYRVTHQIRYTADDAEPLDMWFLVRDPEQSAH